MDLAGEELPDAWRMTALTCILVGLAREHVEITAGKHTKLDDLRKELMKYAKQRRLAHHRGQTRNNMDLGCMVGPAGDATGNGAT